MAPLLLGPEYVSLLYAAKMYIVSICEKVERERLEIENGDRESIQPPDDVPRPPMLSPHPQASFNRLKFLTSKIQAARESSSTVTDHQDSILSQLQTYLTDVCDENVADGLTFWARKLPRYSKLSDLGEDLMAILTSQAYVERIFSLAAS